MLQKKRAKAVLPEPAGPSTIQLDGEYGLTAAGEAFVLLNPVTDLESRGILILGTIENLRLLSAAPTAFSDGSWDMVPSFYEQVKLLFSFIRITVLVLA